MYRRIVGSNSLRARLPKDCSIVRFSAACLSFVLIFNAIIRECTFQIEELAGLVVDEEHSCKSHLCALLSLIRVCQEPLLCNETICGLVEFEQYHLHQQG